MPHCYHINFPPSSKFHKLHTASSYILPPQLSPKVSPTCRSELLLHLVSSALCCFACTILCSCRPLLDRIRSLLCLISNLCVALGSTDSELTQDPLDAARKSLKYAFLRGRRAIAEVIRIASSCLPKFVGGATLVVGDPVGVKV